MAAYLRCNNGEIPYSRDKLHFCKLSFITSFTTLSTNSAGNKLVIFFLFFWENRIWLFMQIVSTHANCLQWRQFAWNVKFCFLRKIRKNISICCLLKFLPRMLSVKLQNKDYHWFLLMYYMHFCKCSGAHRCFVLSPKSKH